MGNPQLEDGYTKIANELLGALAQIRIPGESMQMLLFIIRKTYGFNKKSDGISTSQIIKGTGLASRSVERARARLKSMGLISTVKNVGTNYLTYSINKRYKEWVYTVKNVGTDKNRWKVPSKMREKVPSKMRYTKETKENIQKKEDFSESEGQKQFRDLYKKIREKKL